MSGFYTAVKKLFDKKFDLIEESEKYNYRVYLSKDKTRKLFRSPNYNYNFNLITGKMESWGKTIEEDPYKCPINNILDLEISTICAHNCKFCYKANNPNGKNMSFETFKKIFDVQSKGLTQIAFGSGYLGVENPDIFKMMDYARSNYVIPNVTVGYVSDETADEFAKRIGAMAISIYEDKDKCYDSVKRMTDRGVSQINIHAMICEETYDRCLQTVEDAATDSRLAKLNAIVLLSLKTKGRGETGFTPISQEKFTKICNRAKELNIGLGMDSCSSLKAVRALGSEVEESVISCEAGGTESSYVNVEGEYFPCSFTEGEVRDDMDWSEGIDVLKCKNTEEFLDKVWNNPKTAYFGNKLRESAKCNECNCRTCPLFNV